MPICVVVLKNRAHADELGSQLSKTNTPITQCQLVPPSGELSNLTSQESNELSKPLATELQTTQIDQIPFFNPKLARKRRQKIMAYWLMPFGFLAGLSFSQMTGLQTFSSLGLGGLGQPLIASLLGMASGLLGSYIATSSVNPPINEDLKVLRKRNEEGRWLLLLETPFGVEVPWEGLQAAQPIEIMRFSDQ